MAEIDNYQDSSPDESDKVESSEGESDSKESSRDKEDHLSFPICARDISAELYDLATCYAVDEMAGDIVDEVAVNGMAGDEVACAVDPVTNIDEVAIDEVAIDEVTVDVVDEVAGVVDDMAGAVDPVTVDVVDEVVGDAIDEVAEEKEEEKAKEKSI
ncbi:hypothetical protein H5410_026728 [Solanum commersonii]|uniref:Uncharacterized protein n=1 Tax=Solanum commersonii TaxID=4109 RepID=A0A9J5Z1H0_SOLCO|nr:hypothetical protein H5410_026728 [Solanum commersonii]